MVVIDFETRSKVDLRKCGASVYARDESTSILCLAYQIAGGDVELWVPDAELKPTWLLTAVENGLEVHAHNVFFDRNIWHWICHKQYGWPDVLVDRWRCSLAACSRLALPRPLEQAGQAMGLAMQKDKVGHNVMMRLCKPKKRSKKDPGIWDNDPAKLRTLYDYCRQDVRAEAELVTKLEPLTLSELKVWQLDQRINLRGIPIDRTAVRTAIELAETVRVQCSEELEWITDGEVRSPTYVARIHTGSKSRTIHFPDLGRTSLRKLSWVR
jgi:DNA polymerase